MATEKELLSAVMMLKTAFPDSNHTDETTELYMRQIADIPGGILEKAVDELIKTARWFPRIADIREVSARLSGNDGNYSAKTNVDQLAGEAIRLEQSFYYDGKLDPSEWEKLASQYENAGRLHRSEYTRIKLGRLQSLTIG